MGDTNKSGSLRLSKYNREKIEITGIVQGVGFRPFVYNLAAKHRLTGYVMNNLNGVVIEIEGGRENIEAFANDVKLRVPALAKIETLSRAVVDTGYNRRQYSEFAIRSSERSGAPFVLIPPDVSICNDCLAELFDPVDRRYLYPFINCTNCGPRFTIIEKLPYDRPNTTMKKFPMCPECRNEYENPADRRFHAQPDACPVCGPRVSLRYSDGNFFNGDPIPETINMLKRGKIVAIKGSGGFHLAVDATSEQAVSRLRQRKQRDEKPFAVMVGNIETARQIADLSDFEETILTGPERPILLAERRTGGFPGFKIADSVAPSNAYYGIMLPYTPIHYLLFFHPEAGGDFHNDKPIFTALVMTSGNISDEPICKDNEEAFAKLAQVADAFLIHDRDIHVRCDDSVVRVSGNKMFQIRRSKGYAPAPVFMKKSVPAILAVGGELKNTLCFTSGKRAFLSQHIGDLDSVPTMGFFKEAVDHFTNIFDIKPKLIAYDLHPDYISTRYVLKAMDQLLSDKIAVVGVQHHHAHIAAVMAEHGIEKPVIGFAMDGTGYGLDGAIWGGEVLICAPGAFRRFAHLDYLPLPGGAKAIKEPWRMAFAHIRRAVGKKWSRLNLPCLNRIDREEMEIFDRAIANSAGFPVTSSLGRLFDAVASILDIKHQVKFEGQAAMMLEMAAYDSNVKSVLPYAIRKTSPEKTEDYPTLWGDFSYGAEPLNIELSDSFIIDYTEMIGAIIDSIDKGMAKSDLAMIFHNILVESFVEIAGLARDLTGINLVALSGGCWQNRILTEKFQARLRDKGFRVFINYQAPVNDGGLALGQAYIAASAAPGHNGR